MPGIPTEDLEFLLVPLDNQHYQRIETEDMTSLQITSHGKLLWRRQLVTSDNDLSTVATEIQNKIDISQPNDLVKAFALQVTPVACDVAGNALDFTLYHVGVWC